MRLGHENVIRSTKVIVTLKSMLIFLKRKLAP